MKQSSIDWIYNNLKSHFEHDGDLLEAVNMSFEQAKAMHKDEMIEVFHAGMYCGDESPNSGIAEQYYNETFNTKEKWKNKMCRYLSFSKRNSNLFLEQALGGGLTGK